MSGRFPPGEDEPARWVLVLPLKGGPAAKSRLGGGSALAGAIALDCLDAVLGCRAVRLAVVVTADPWTADQVAARGVVVVPERVPGSGLVPAVRDGLDHVRLHPGPVAVLLGDLPALRPQDLDAALAAVGTVLAGPSGARMAAVPDAAGTGTVLLAARAAQDLDPRFGPDSLAEHRRSGAAEVRLAVPRLRQDVDTPADLAVAVALGVGPRTRAALAGT